MRMQPVIEIKGLAKTYDDGFQALKSVDLEISKGEIFALLGPNGAGKTTLISIVCGIVNASAGSVAVAGYDIKTDYRKTRAMIGLVPQELTTEAFESVWDTITFSRGLFGKPKDPAYLEQLLKDLSLFDKRDSKIMTLSGGMKRRVLIAKALSHEPEVLFLDEPTAGMSPQETTEAIALVDRITKDRGLTLLFTEHDMGVVFGIADRISVLHHGEIIASGLPEEVRNDPEVRRVYLGESLDGEDH